MFALDQPRAGLLVIVLIILADCLMFIAVLAKPRSCMLIYKLVSVIWILIQDQAAYNNQVLAWVSHS